MNANANESSQGSDGSLSLRDLFAAHVVGAIFSAPKLAGVPRLDTESMAKQAYEIADAMIRARGK